MTHRRYTLLRVLTWILTFAITTVMVTWPAWGIYVGCFAIGWLRASYGLSLKRRYEAEQARMAEIRIYTDGIYKRVVH